MNTDRKPRGRSTAMPFLRRRMSAEAIDKWMQGGTNVMKPTMLQHPHKPATNSAKAPRILAEMGLGLRVHSGVETFLVALCSISRKLWRRWFCSALCILVLCRGNTRERKSSGLNGQRAANETRRGSVARILRTWAPRTCAVRAYGWCAPWWAGHRAAPATCLHVHRSFCLHASMLNTTIS